MYRFLLGLTGWKDLYVRYTNLAWSTDSWEIVQSCSSCLYFILFFHNPHSSKRWTCLRYTFVKPDSDTATTHLQGNVLCKTCLIQSRKETSLQATDRSTYPPTGWVMGPVFAFELEVPGISLHLEQWQAICARKRAWVSGGKQNRDIKRLLLASCGRWQSRRPCVQCAAKPTMTDTSPPLHNACVCQLILKHVLSTPQQAYQNLLCISYIFFSRI